MQNSIPDVMHDTVTNGAKRWPAVRVTPGAQRPYANMAEDRIVLIINNNTPGAPDDVEVKCSSALRYGLWL